MAKKPYDYDKDPNPYKSPPLPKDDKKWVEKEKAKEGQWVSGENLEAVLPLLWFLADSEYSKEVKRSYSLSYEVGIPAFIIEDCFRRGSCLSDKDIKLAPPKIPHDFGPGYRVFEAVNINADALIPRALTGEEDKLLLEIKRKLAHVRELITSYIDEHPENGINREKEDWHARAILENEAIVDKLLSPFDPLKKVSPEPLNHDLANRYLQIHDLGNRHLQIHDLTHVVKSFPYWLKHGPFSRLGTYSAEEKTIFAAVDDLMETMGVTGALSDAPDPISEAKIQHNHDLIQRKRHSVLYHDMMHSIHSLDRNR